MSYNSLKPRTLSIPASQIEPSTEREPISSRVKYISWCPPHRTSQELPLTELSDLNDIKQRIGISSRFKEADIKEEDLNSTINFSKENVNVDADDLFDNFDDCFQARFPSQESTISQRSKDNKTLPVCRDLLSEFAADSARFVSGLSGVKSPLSFASSHSHKPHELLVHKAEMYFDMNTPRDTQLQNNLYVESRENAKLNQNVKITRRAPRPYSKVEEDKTVYSHEEDVENEEEGIAQKSVKNFMDLRNKNQDSAERPTSHIQRHTHKDIPITRLVLNDVTNNIPRYRKGSVHDGGDSSRLSTADILTKRKLAERETVEGHRRNSVIQNTYNKTRKISISELFSSLRTKENHFVPSARSSYNGKICEGRKSVERGEDKPKSIADRPKSVCKDIPNYRTQNKVRASVERQSIKAENNQNGTHKKSGRKAYDTLIKYFEIAKQGFTASSAKNTGKLASANRK